MALAQEIQGYDIIVVAGQSNAAGWGSDAGEPATSSKDPRIFQWTWNNEGTIIAAQNPLQTPSATNPKKIHGFALPFAEQYVQNNLQGHPERAVLIINAAVGGSRIDEWREGGKLYRQAIDGIQASLGQNPRNKVVAILWHQGEADIKLSKQQGHSEAQVKEYGAKLEGIIRNFRKDIPHKEKLPFIAGEMSRRWQEATDYRKSYVAQIHQTILKTENAGFVTSENLKGNKFDQIHFSGESQKILGLRYFKAYQQISGSHPSCRQIFLKN